MQINCRKKQHPRVTNITYSLWLIFSAERSEDGEADGPAYAYSQLPSHSISLFWQSWSCSHPDERREVAGRRRARYTSTHITLPTYLYLDFFFAVELHMFDNSSAMKLSKVAKPPTFGALFAFRLRRLCERFMRDFDVFGVCGGVSEGVSE